MAYLDDHPPKRKQFTCPRRQGPSGVIVVHTAENTPDFVAFDGGAEAVARFIQGRSDAGSYHDLCDSDSVINMVRYDCEAYHDGTGTNPHSYGVSAATRADVWPLAPAEWQRGCVRNMAAAAANYARWLKSARGITIPARRITREQSTNRIPGFISHAERDPGRRSDPGNGFPWNDFLGYFAIFTNTEDDMTPQDWDRLTKELAAMEARIVQQVVGNKPLIVTGDGTGEGQLNNWYAVPAITKSEVTRDDAAQAVAQGGARWWQPDVHEPLKIPQAELDSYPLVGEDSPDV